MTTRAEREQATFVSTEMSLLARFMDMVVDDPSIADEIPGGATVFFLPEDDPELAAAEQAAADKAAQAGIKIYVRSLPPVSTTV